MEIKSGIIRLEFTPEQVESINGYQRSGYWHPFTCAYDHTGDDVLIAKPAGLECPSCDYKQNWVHTWMADGSWQKMGMAIHALQRRGNAEQNS